MFTNGLLKIISDEKLSLSLRKFMKNIYSPVALTRK